ncbi:hypothetical protein NB231_13716 [Nitrococcus mobilis Nb-231]|uniref:Uncharacterized protein n=1 Tax=Nitrococcus mobilis Nb-231 TaxID=314278 RepID=A4BVH6_9GAMM|nr:hypothetical protein NB231_13716 [Nitrococcus mobilis Nb-231]
MRHGDEGYGAEHAAKAGCDNLSHCLQRPAFYNTVGFDQQGWPHSA